jgi:hypothetical protein
MIEAFRNVQEYCKKQVNCDQCQISEEIGSRCFFLKPKEWNLPDPALKKVKDHIMSRFMRKD